MIFTTSTALLASALFSGAYSHMVMRKPQPYNFAQLVNSPLSDELGFAFPCHVGGGYTLDDPSAQPTEAKAGDSIEVQFEGSAVHGGGVCQFSVTYEDPPPADPSKWKVIHTVIGGCPADAGGNLDETNLEDNFNHPTGNQCADGETTECLPTFQIPISKDLKNGKAVFAWTWFNKIGNREMYMNCAPITITGGKEDDSGMANMPPMLVANIGADTCKTLDGLLDIGSFAGPSVTANQEPVAGTLGTCTAPGGGGGGDTGNAVTPEVPAVSPTTPQPSNPVTPPSNPAPPNPPPVQSQPETPAPSGGNQIECKAEGEIFCISTTQWAKCANGWATPMPVSAGLQCVDGNPSTPAKTRKRHVHRHLRPHARSFI